MADIIDDIASGVFAFPELLPVENIYATALAAKDAWVVEHNLSSTRVSSFDSDDGITLLDLGFAPIVGSSEKRIVVSGESAVSFYYAPITNGAAAGATINTGGVAISRMHLAAAPPPTVAFLVRPNTQEAGVGTSYWQKAANVAVLYYRTGQFGSRVATDVAIRIRPSKLEFVITQNTAESQNFSFAQFSQTGSLVAVNAKYIKSALADTMSFSTPDPRLILGTVVGTSGLPDAAIVRAYKRSTGKLEAQTMSDGITGEFLLKVYDAAEYNVVSLSPDTGSIRNDLIHRVIPA